MAFFDARSCSVQYVVFDPSTGRCAPVDPVLDYDEKSVPTAAPSADALLAFACESETSRLNEFAIPHRLPARLCGQSTRAIIPEIKVPEVVSGIVTGTRIDQYLAGGQRLDLTIPTH
jgi:hypothetical protein